MIFTAALVTAGGFLAFDAFFRKYGVVQHALMNVEGIAALSFVGLLLARARYSELAKGADNAVTRAVVLAAIIVVVSLAFAPVLRTPFLYDDYTHITEASRFTWRMIAQEFGPAPNRGIFFRPVGFLLYWLNYLWVGSNPTWWHAGNIALHAVCSCLTYVLCREVGLSRPASLGGALLFGLGGVSAEAVAWVDAGFVTVTTAPVLISLIFVCRYAATNRPLWLAGALAAGACAMLSKETAYCLPFLVASLALFGNWENSNRIWRATGFVSVLTVALFIYRWWVLKGIGGYTGSGGEANILQFNFIRTVDALLLRQWAVLFFPFNWSTSVGPMLRGAVVATPVVLAACAWMARLPRRPLIGCLAFILAAGLPVEHLLLISPDLGGSRTLYLGNVGWALLWALVLDNMGWTPRMVAAAGVLLLLQGRMLEHDLLVWRATAESARAVCVAFGQTIRGSTGPVVVRGLPATRNGAVFLKNGFPECVEMNSGVTAARIQVQEMPKSGAREFVWNDASGRLEEAVRR